MFFSKEKKILKEMGFLSDQLGIMNRYIREEGAWENHLENTKNYILKKAKQIRNKQQIVVLGTGWLLDIPYHELSLMFSNCYFVDIWHPQQIKHKIQKYPNIQLVSYDITGGIIKNAYKAQEKYKKQGIKTSVDKLLCTPQNWGLPDSLHPDLVVSVNLLNQLDILIVDNLKKSAIYSEEELQKLTTKIQQIHVEALKKHRTILISDIKEIHFDDDNNITGKKTLVFVDLQKIEKKWIWDFDLTKNYYPDRNTRFEVIAVEV